MSNNDDNGDKPNGAGKKPENVIDIKDWVSGKHQSSNGTILGQNNTATGPNIGSPVPPTAEQQRVRQKTYILSLEDGDITIEGLVGLTPSFLAIGDVHGNIKFAAAQGKWKYCSDITDYPQMRNLAPVFPENAFWVEEVSIDDEDIPEDPEPDSVA